MARCLNLVTLIRILPAMSKQPFPLPSRTDDASLDVVTRLATPVSTQMAQHAYVAPGGFQAPQQPVYRASTVFFENTAAMHSRDWRSRERYSYGLHGTPTSFALEARIARHAQMHQRLRTGTNARGSRLVVCGRSWVGGEFAGSFARGFRSRGVT